MDISGLPDWYTAMEWGFTSSTEMREKGATIEEVDEIMKELAPKISYDSPYKTVDVIRAKNKSILKQMTHENYRQYHDARVKIEKILRVLDAFDPITGRGLNAMGERDASVLSEEE